MAPRRTTLLLVAAGQTHARLGQLAADEQQIWADLRAQFEASANGTRFLYEEDQRAWARDHRPQFNVSRILQDETPAPTVKGKEDHCPRCWWRKSPPDPDHWWPAMTTTQRNGIGPVRWEGQVGGAERMSCPVGWGQVNKDNIRLRVEKKWERVCFYCWKAKLSDARDMERLIAHTTWDEQQYYRLFYIWGCGGMFGTPRFAAPGGCEKKSIEFKLEVDSKGRRVPEGPDGLHEVTIPLTKNTRPPLGFECCTRKLGWDACSGALAIGGNAVAFASFMVGAVVLLAG